MDFEEYLNLTVDALRRWRDMHADPEIWADEWLMGDPAYFISSCGATISNNYFYVNVADEALKLYIDEHINEWYVCPECGACYHSSDDASDCENEHGFDFDDNASKEELFLYLTDIYYDSKDLAEWLIWLCGEDIIRRATEGAAFEAYRAALSPLTAPVEEEIETTLNQIENATSPEELLMALGYANHINHVSGNIMDDYGEGTIDYIAQYGMQYSVQEAASYLGYELMGA